MTTTRATKTTHQVQLRNASQHGITSVRFASPALAQAAKADRGHSLMTGAEYREHRMGRGARTAPAAWGYLMADRGFRAADSGAWIKTTRR